MKRLVLIAALLSGPAWGAIAGVQYKAGHAATTATTSLIITPTSTTTVNNTVVLGISYSKCAGCASPHTVGSVVDSGGSAYALLAGPVQHVTNGQVEEVWSTGIGAAHASTTVTVTIAGTPASIDLQVTLGEYSGVVTTGNTQPAQGTGTTTSISLTSQNANNWAVSSAYNDSCGATFTAVSGTIRTTDTGNGSSCDVVLMDSGPASGTVTHSWTDASAGWVTAMVELCAQTPCSGAAGGTAAKPRRSMRGYGQ